MTATTLWIAFGAIVAALIMREVKISEFRQAWINDLRTDISDYISKVHEWVDLYQVFNEEENQEQKKRMTVSLDRIKYDSFHVLRRIELRFKPSDVSANALIEKLKHLLDPQKVPPPNPQLTWAQLADNAVDCAQSLLKEEWETTKNPLRKFCSQRRAPNTSLQGTATPPLNSDVRHNMTTPIAMDTSVTLRQAFLVMFAYLEEYYEFVGKPDEIGCLLSEISLWDTESGGKEPMDGAVFPQWLNCASAVLATEARPEGYRGADILFDDKPPTLKVQR
ncbi:hypothetical protein FACS189497_09550 [Betaproteobacteria bacterium]|nr:hypothetical protein FACS189497_09550 [Betaproteobacteria bacterium]